MCRSGDVPNITRAVEWYHASRGGNLPPATFRIEPVRLNGTTHQRDRRGGNLPPATLQIQPVWLNGTTPRHVIPRE